MFQAQFEHIIQFGDNFEGDIFDEIQFEHQPIPDPVEDPAQPQPVEPQQSQPARRARPPKPKEEDPEYKPRSVQPIPDPNSVARRTRARRPDEFPHEPFGVLDSICAVDTNHISSSSPDSQWAFFEYS